MAEMRACRYCGKPFEFVRGHVEQFCNRACHTASKRQRGYTNNNSRLSWEQRDEAVRLYTTPLEDGTWLGIPTIARQFGVTPQSVRNILRKHGVALRSSREAFAQGKRTKPIKNVPPPGQPAPSCKCGCGAVVAWNQRKNRWNVYVEGHYRQEALYKNRDWLHAQYVTAKRTLEDIAAECGVGAGPINHFMAKFSIPVRDASDAHAGRQAGAKNPAWRGGIAKWNYTSDWKRVARRIKRRDGYACQVCGKSFPKTSKLLHVHHGDGNRSNNDDSNLLSLCATCHSAKEMERKRSLRAS